MDNTEQKQQVAAFFDLDRTLISVNSARSWIEEEYRDGRIPLVTLLEAAVWIAGYRLGLLNVEQAITRAINTLKGYPEHELVQRTQRWFDERVADTVRPEARAAIGRHRMQNHWVVLLTSSSNYVATSVQRELSLDAILCTWLEVSDGRFTGTVVPPVCYGRGKVELARRFAQKNQLDLARSYFYTDSYSDLPMLETVGHPRVVCPDIRLRRTARQRGWTIEEWSPGRPASVVSNSRR